MDNTNSQVLKSDGRLNRVIGAYSSQLNLLLIIYLWSYCRKIFVLAMNLTLGYLSRVLLRGIKTALPI